jgi:hypothetical protein
VKVGDAMPLQSNSRSHTAELARTGALEHDFFICDGRRQGIQIFEGDFVPTLDQPTTCAALPGRKTDRMDGERISELMQYGLLKASFTPPPPIRKLRTCAGDGHT